MLPAARVLFRLAVLLVTLPGCVEGDEDGCSEANEVAQQILDQAEQDGIAPESVCQDAERPEKYDALCERHAELMAECDD
ncbi:MAG: hypothetical protein M3020_23130 [Myxococcota bacterium]|jgi:hypothetical protein|nr:hypothetical protein [Myxococcota bacterium]